MMQDRKALQAGTSHFLGQNFAKASDIQIQSAGRTEEYAWTTSWGVSTRLIGGLIMTHSDDDGMILPPRVASAHVVLMPIIRKDRRQADGHGLHRQTGRPTCGDSRYHGRPLRVEIDDRDIGGARELGLDQKRDSRCGWKSAPGTWRQIRFLSAGGTRTTERKIFHGQRSFRRRYRRDCWMKSRTTLFQRALDFRKAHTRNIDDKEDFYDFFTPEDKEQPGNSRRLCHVPLVRRRPPVKQRSRRDLSVTIRCIPFDARREPERPAYCIASMRR